MCQEASQSSALLLRAASIWPFADSPSNPQWEGWKEQKDMAHLHTRTSMFYTKLYSFDWLWIHWLLQCLDLAISLWDHDRNLGGFHSHKKVCTKIHQGLGIRSTLVDHQLHATNLALIPRSFVVYECECPLNLLSVQIMLYNYETKQLSLISRGIHHRRWWVHVNPPSKCINLTVPLERNKHRFLLRTAQLARPWHQYWQRCHWSSSNLQSPVVNQDSRCQTSQVMKSCSLYPKRLNCLNESAILNSPVLCIAAANFCCILYTILRILESTCNMACQKKHLTPSSNVFDIFDIGALSTKRKKKQHNGVGKSLRFTASPERHGCWPGGFSKETLKKCILSPGRNAW